MTILEQIFFGCLMVGLILVVVFGIICGFAFLTKLAIETLKREKLIELLNDCEAKGFWSYGTDCKTGEHGGHDMTAEDIADYLLENCVTFKENDNG